MDATHLVELLQAVLRGEAHFQDLVARVDEVLAESPAQAAGFEVELDALYARNEIRYDVYLHLKDRCSQGLSHPATTTGRTGRDPAATELRPAPAQPAGAPASADRTMLRAPGGTAPRIAPAGHQASQPARHSAGRPPNTPTGGSSTGASWGDGFDQTLVVEPPLDRGTRVKDRFVLEERLGEGGMGVVFKARDLRKEEAQDRDPYVAIKFLNSEFRRHPESLKALQRETRRAQTLAHPNVVTVYDFDRDGTLIYMTMEYLAGEPLDLHIKRHAQGVRFRDAWPIIEGAGRALMYAHEQGVIHADFKPSNVFVSDKKAKVLDFGIARAMQANIGGNDGTRFDAGSLGALTPAYASPEMLLNETPDPRDDVYALACVAYELMTGRHPYNGQNAVKAEHDGLKVKRTTGMGRYQYKALLHGLAFRRNERTPSVEAFLDEIAGPFGVRGRALRQTLLSTAGTALLVGVTAIGITFFMRPDPDQQLGRRIVETATAQHEAYRRDGIAVPADDPEMRKVLLEQGNDYLAMARAAFDPGVLSEGVSNAYGAFQQVLLMQPADPDAVAGVVEIVRIYDAEIQRRLEAGDFARVVELAGYARKIDPSRASLEEAEREARSVLASEPTAARQE